MTAELVIASRGLASLKRQHPWVFSGAIGKAPGGIGKGETVVLVAPDGRWLAWGAYSPRSQIRVRVWSFDSQETIDAAFFKKRLAAAIAFRDRMPGLLKRKARRLVNAESDGLPGLVVDQYAEFVVCQFLAAGAERWKDVIVSALKELVSPRGIYERSDTDGRKKEGLPICKGVLWGAAPPELNQVAFDNVTMAVDLVNGHKTGLYLDQCDNHALVRAHAREAQVLNCFCYTGGFGLWALKGGAAQITQVDASEGALALARRNLTLNGLDDRRTRHVAGNVFAYLRQCRDAGRRFDLVILDPPKFAASRGQLQRGSRGYKDINLLAFKLLRPGGVLFTFSCSGLLSAALFQKIVADAALDAGRRVRLVGRLQQAGDHPVALNFPEGRYLKGLICNVD